MTRQYPSDIAFTEAVKAIRSRKGSRAVYARMEHGEGWQAVPVPEKFNGRIAEFEAEIKRLKAAPITT